MKTKRMSNDYIHVLRLRLFAKTMKTHFATMHLELHFVFTSSDRAKVAAVEVVNLELRL